MMMMKKKKEKKKTWVDSKQSEYLPIQMNIRLLVYISSRLICWSCIARCLRCCLKYHNISIELYFPFFSAKRLNERTQKYFFFSYSTQESGDTKTTKIFSFHVSLVRIRLAIYSISVSLGVSHIYIGMAYFEEKNNNFLLFENVISKVIGWISKICVDGMEEKENERGRRRRSKDHT